MIIRVPARSGGACPIDRVKRGKATRRRGRSRPATLNVAQDYAAVGLPVFPLWPGDKCPNSPRRGNATTDADRILAKWTRWLTANVGVGLPRVVGRTQGGQGT